MDFKWQVVETTRRFKLDLSRYDPLADSIARRGRLLRALHVGTVLSGGLRIDRQVTCFPDGSAHDGRFHP